MSVNVEGKMDKTTMIKWLISVFCTACVFLVPLSEVYTSQMRSFFVITVFSLFIIGFEFFDNIVPAVFMPVCWVVFGVTDFGTAFSGFTSSVVFMCLGSYLLASILIEVGLLNRIAYWCLVHCGGTFKGLMIGVFLTGWVLTIVTFGGAGLIMTAIAYGICIALGLEKGRTSAAIMMAVLLGAVSSRLGYYSPTTLALPLSQVRQVLPDFDITFLQAIWHNWPSLIMCVISLLVIIKWYGPKGEEKNKFNGRAYFEEKLKELGPMSLREKKSAGFVVFLMAYMVLQPLHGFPSDYAFMFFPWLLFFPGFSVANNNSFGNLNYPMIFFLVACMGIGTVATKIGLGAIIANAFIPYFQTGSMGTIIVLLFGMCFGLNFLMTPMAIFSLLTIPVTNAVISIGMDPRPFVYTLLHSCEAIIFPYEFVPYLMTYSFGMMAMGDFIKLNIVRSLIYSVGIGLILVPWWYLIGVIAPL